MEAKFRCDSAYTRELIQEFYEYCCFRRPRYIVYHIIFALALAFWRTARAKREGGVTAWRFSLKKVFPFFILFFVLASLITTAATDMKPCLKMLRRPSFQ